MNPIYLDYNATTPVDPEVVSSMTDALQYLFGNPSSSHLYGVDSSRAIMKARNRLAALLNCHSDEIIFTSGGTESNNIAIQGAAFARRHLGSHIITSSVEHPAVAEVCRFLEQHGFSVTWLPVDSYGMVAPEECLKAIRPDTILISVMHANNETGTIQPVEEIGRIAREHGILFHSDAAQSVGKIIVDVRSMGVDLLSVAGHKLYAPKGIGALFIKRGLNLQKLVHGADHESNRRPGTENVVGIVGLGKAAEIVSLPNKGGENSPHPLPLPNKGGENSPHPLPLPNKGGEKERLKYLRDLLHEGILEAVPEVRLNGHPELRLPNTLSLGFPGAEASLLLQAMPEIAASAGAACHTGEEEVSGVLAAMHVPMDYAMGTIRFSVGRMTTEEEIYRAIPFIVNAYRSIMPPNPHMPPNPLKGAYSSLREDNTPLLPPNPLKGAYSSLWEDNTPLSPPNPLKGAYSSLREDNTPLSPPNPLKGAYSSLREDNTPRSGSKSPLGDLGAVPAKRSKSPLGDLGANGDLGAIRLTTYSHALGCACKIRPQLLEEILKTIPVAEDPRVLVGTETSDDASVFKLNEQQALVQTVDFIPPVVDDPYFYGAIAASNALSDIYAMGATPLYALNLVGFPDARLPMSVLQDILKGASDVTQEAGVPILGGHSIELTEPVFGLTITGLVDPAKIIRNTGIQTGDALVLTKPIGTGILTTALKKGLLEPQMVDRLMNIMKRLNKISSEVMMRYPVHACTDVTGFGLLGHLKEMIGTTQVEVKVDLNAVPVMEMTRECISMGSVPGGTRNNLAYVEQLTIWNSSISEGERLLLCDAQTSGGLLIALPEAHSGSLVQALHAEGQAEAAIIGRVFPGKGTMTINP